MKDSLPLPDKVPSASLNIPAPAMLNAFQVILLGQLTKERWEVFMVWAPAL